MKNITNLHFLILVSLVFTLLISCQTQTTHQNDNGLIIKTSENSFELTYKKLKKVLEANPKLNILFELDHKNNANKVSLNLNKSKLILFGNPKIGTPLMQNQLSSGIDLPQKILIYENENNVVKVVYNDLLYLKQRHNITNKKDAALTKISKALSNITNKITENEN